MSRFSRRPFLATVASGALARPSFSNAAGRYLVIDIDKMKFGVSHIELKAGDTVRWRNKDLVRHTATARDGSFDIDLPRGEEGSIYLVTPGKMEVYCRFHPGMIMTLSIVE